MELYILWETSPEHRRSETIYSIANYIKIEK